MHFPPRELLGGFIPLLLPSSGAAWIEGYAVPCSIRQGDTVSICVSTDASAFDVQIFRVGARELLVHEAHGVPGFVQAVPESAWAGCDWTPSLQVLIPQEWPSGVYRVALDPGTPFGTRYATFTVFEDSPGSTARILFQNSTATWQAYNGWGGRSLYDWPSGNPRAHIVSYQRPYIEGLGMGSFPQEEENLVVWLESEGFGVEYCTERELHTGDVPLAAYDLVLIVGHCEYISKEMRDDIEAHVAALGNVAIFGGNTCWWQIRFDEGTESIICYKEDHLDPLYGVDNERVTVRWHENPVNRPANHWTGASLLHGGDPAGNHAYKVWKPDHWVFENTELVFGEEFGSEDELAGNEVDGADLVWIGGLPVPTGSDGTPLSFEILATSPATFGWATMGVLQEGGTVFNASSITWADGVASNAIAQQVTRNVIEELVEGDPYAPRDGRVELLDIGWCWSGSDLLINMMFRNRSVAQTSRRTEVHADARRLGGSPVIHYAETLELSPLLPGEITALQWTIPGDSLPPSAARLVAGENDPVPGCLVGNEWTGQLNIEWSEAGTNVTNMVARGHVGLPVCPNSDASAAQLAVQVNASSGHWAFLGMTPGWFAELRENDSGAPGNPAPNPLPPGPFDGWLCISADDNVVTPALAEMIWTIVTGSDTANVHVDAQSCDCFDPTGIPGESIRPLALQLHPPHPNPARHQVRVGYDLPKAAVVRLTVHDIAGRMVRVLLDREHDDGTHTLQWNLSNEQGDTLPAGVYFFRLAADDEVSTRTIVVAR
jgi:hypothetical protein